MTHTCPGPGCKRRVPSHMLMCRTHWYQVPKPLRNRVYRAWDNGEGAGTGEHRDACNDAIMAIGGDVPLFFDRGA